jgi:hypothetical protein
MNQLAGADVTRRIVQQRPHPSSWWWLPASRMRNGGKVAGTEVSGIAELARQCSSLFSDFAAWWFHFITHGATTIAESRLHSSCPSLHAGGPFHLKHIHEIYMAVTEITAEKRGEHRCPCECDIFVSMGEPTSPKLGSSRHPTSSRF